MLENEYSVLEQYNVGVRNIRKIRGAMLCDTEQGVYLMKEVQLSEERIEALAELYESLESQCWYSVDKLLKNKEEKYITSMGNGSKYILKRWFDGRECDSRKPGELIEAAGVLAKLHIAMQKKLNYPVTKAALLGEEYKAHNRELNRVRNYIRKRTSKKEFEKEFLKCFELMYEWADTANEMLEESAYENLYRESVEKHCMVHGEYNYHNIIMNQCENSNTLAAVTNFEKFKQDIQVEDFYYFLRKTMEKSGWKERLGDSLFNAYSVVRPMSSDEIEYVKIRLVYPEKFWKIANSYYYSNKAWISAKSIEKLDVAIRQTKEKERFLKNVFSFEM